MVPDLVTVGGLTIDNVVASDGTVALARVGGNAAYSGAGARCFADTVGLVSMAVASYPEEVLSRLASNGFLFDGVTRSPVHLRYTEWFIYDDAGDRVDRLRSLPGDLTRAGFSDVRLSPVDVSRWVELLRVTPPPAEPSYSQFRHMTPMTALQVPASYLSSRGVHLAPSRLDVLSEMADLFRPVGVPLTLDPGWQLAELALDELSHLLSKVDAFLPSAIELAALVPGANRHDALRELADRCRGTVAVKLGRQGSLVWDRASNQAVAVPSLTVPAVDPTGAGDSWCGGFLAGLVETGDPVKAACFGSVAAARIVSHFGADGSLPIDMSACRSDLDRLLAMPAPRTV